MKDNFATILLTIFLVSNCAADTTPATSATSADDVPVLYDGDLCIFSYANLFEHRELETRTDYFRPLPSEDQISLKVSELTEKATGTKFYQYKTYRDEDDGGNTIGWVESSYRSGRKILGMIGDSEFYDCAVKAPAGNPVITIENVAFYGDEDLEEIGESYDMIDYFRFFDTENAILEASVVFEDGHGPASLAKGLSEQIWGLTMGDIRFDDVECGNLFNGDLSAEGVEAVWLEDAYRTYMLSGSDDGYINTCSGRGGSGWWSFAISTSYDLDNRTFSISLETGEE